jgi:hypothetical protein
LPEKFWTHHPIDRRAVLTPAFAIYQAECESKIPKLEADLATAQRKLDEALQSFDSSLDCLCL